MKHVAAYLFVLGLLLLVFTPSSSAVQVLDPTVTTDISSEPIIVSAAPFGVGTAFVELTNRSNTAVHLSGYEIILVYGVGESAIEEVIMLPDQYVIADGFVALAEHSEPGYRDVTYTLSSSAWDQQLSSIILKTPGNKYILQLENPEPTATKYTWLKRKSGVSGLGSLQSNFTQQEGVAQINGMGLFIRPDMPTVSIVEILPRPEACSPFDSSLTCRDYIKLYNSHSHAIALDDYALRTDSSTSSSSNRFSLDIDISAYGYVTIAYRDDLAPLSLTDSGGNVWLEDREAIAPYTETLVEYPSSLTATIGMSWATDANGQWSWTVPQPDKPNIFYTAEEEPIDVPDATVYADCGEGKFRNPDTNRCKSIAADDGLSPCATGQERNPDTNRCRSVAASTSSLVPCAVGQERNPDTNRCRSTASTSSSLVPCSAGQVRNPETNRCRSATSTASVLKPCAVGQERNPETNRCRKIPGATLASSTNAIDQNGASANTAQALPWYSIVGAIGVVAAGYGAWEWRGELASATRRLSSLFGKAK